MNGVVTFAIDGKKDKYATRMEKEEIKEMRHKRMTRSERYREWSANILKVILLFGVPVMLSLVMFIVLAVVYIVRPYALTRDFTRTTCKVSGYTILNHTLASCSAGTDSFEPCVKIQVFYATGEEYRDGVIMENEQSLVNCNPCSYTFGRHGLLHEYQYACESWKEYFDPTLCINDFVSKNAVFGSVHPCFFNPHNPDQVVRDLILDENTVIHAISWPILSCLIYLLALGFVCYDSKQRKMLDKRIEAEIAYKRQSKRLERYHAAQWKKQRLGHTLGVRSPMQSPNSFVLRATKDLKRLSASLPSLAHLVQREVIIKQSSFTESSDDLVNDDSMNFDLRHLDLAVSQQNLNDLTTTYPCIETSLPLSYENVSAELCVDDDYSIGMSRVILPVIHHSPRSTFRRNTEPLGKSTNVLFHGERSSFSLADQRKINTHRTNVGSHSFAPMMNGSMFYRGHQDVWFPESSAVSEDEIDQYYSVDQRLSRNVIKDSQVVDIFSGNDESRV